MRIWCNIWMSFLESGMGRYKIPRSFDGALKLCWEWRAFAAIVAWCVLRLEYFLWVACIVWRAGCKNWAEEAPRSGDSMCSFNRWFHWPCLFHKTPPISAKF